MRFRRATLAQGSPPGPRGLPIIGNLQSYEEDRLGFLMDMRRNYGGVARFDSRTTVISDPGLADQILRDPTRTFEVDQNLLGQRLTSAQIEAVLDVRPLLNPGLRPHAVTAVARHVAALTCATLSTAGAYRREAGSAVDPLALAERVIPHAFSWHLFGEGEVPFVANVADLLDSLEHIIGNVMAPPASWRSPQQRRIERQHRDLHQKVRNLLLRNAAGSPASDSAPVGLAHQLARTAQSSQDLDAIADLLIGAMLAAQRVPAAGAGWTLMLVADDPVLQRTLREEAVVFSEGVRRGGIAAPANSPVALATVLEALRLYPPTWLITRTAMRDTQLGGYAFPARHMFMISPYVLQRDPELFPDPLTFHPRRWTTRQPTSKAYLPFGRGRHRCPGADLATTAIVAMLLSLQHGRLMRRSGEVTPSARNTLRPVGLSIHLHDLPRQQSTACPAAHNPHATVA